MLQSLQNILEGQFTNRDRARLALDEAARCNKGVRSDLLSAAQTFALLAVADAATAQARADEERTFNRFPELS